MGTVSLDQIQEKQKDMQKKAEKLAQEKDGERIAAMAEDLKKDGKQLEAMCKVFEMEQQQEAEAARVKPPPGPKGAVQRPVKIKLTEPQREMIEKRYGLRLDVIEVPDPQGNYRDTMTARIPPDIDALAEREAEKRKLAAEAEQARKAQMAAIMDELTKQNNPEINKALEEAMKRAGMLDKK
jgi:hypothetical protein